MIKTYTHKNIGTCSKSVDITYDTDNHKIIDVKFLYGCPGNTKGIEKLCQNRTLEEVRDALKGVMCGNKNTSCPNELSKGIDDILENL